MQHLFPSQPRLTALLSALIVAFGAPVAQASSHREAPSIAGSPRVDGTDFYLFRSYENNRADYVTMIANYLPLQDAYGGPNYFKLDPNALYEIHIDNNGDAKEDLTFQFQFKNNFKNIKLPIGNQMVGIPLTQVGTVSNRNDAALNVNEQFTMNIVRGDRRTGTVAAVTNAATGSATFDKPSDNIGVKTIPDYASYAGKHIYSVNIPGCAMPAKVFVGQRQEAFAVNLGVIFDLVNAPVGVITDPTLINAAAANSIQDKNVTTLALEVHKSCLTQGSETVIGGWTSASVRQSQLVNPNPPSGYQTSTTFGGAWVQVSRLGMPLVNEVVIGLADKDKFNASVPRNDGQFATYVTHPTLPALLETVLSLPGTAPTNLPRLDLVTTFLTGIPGVNQPAGVVPSEMLRLNTAIAPVPFAQQSRLGIVGSLLSGSTDFAGFPNGRRPKDDVVDVSLVAVMGGLCVANGNANALGFGPACNPGAVPLGATAFKLHDAVDQAVVPLLPGFPYLNTPNPGSK
ncbi:MAG: DUF4331 domain-containing protein [Pseudomonadota bacterium]|nr:DUF4331 domain-containing protein [Pseudomonadota bacterium]